MSERKTREKRQEELSKKVGDILVAAHNAHLEEIVHTSKRLDDYIVTVAFEPADGVYAMGTDGELDWQTPESFGSMHVEVIVQDRDDKRFVPYLDVSVRIYTNDHTLVTEAEAPFMWHPFAYHYGFDTVIPDEGKYYAEIEVKAPAFPRHHRSQGRKYADNVTVRMAPVELMPPGTGETEDDILRQ